jgi:hypothetical protein
MRTSTVGASRTPEAREQVLKYLSFLRRPALAASNRSVDQINPTPNWTFLPSTNVIFLLPSMTFFIASCVRDKQRQERGGTTLIVVASCDPVAVWHYASQNRLILMLG